MQTVIDHIEDIVSKAGDLAETKIEIWKMKTADKVSVTLSSLISLFVVLSLAGIAVIVLSIGAAFWIGRLLDNTSYGFFIIGGFYALAGLLVYLFRKAIIKKPISGLIVNKLTN